MDLNSRNQPRQGERGPDSKRQFSKSDFKIKQKQADGFAQLDSFKLTANTTKPNAHEAPAQQYAGYPQMQVNQHEQPRHYLWNNQQQPPPGNYLPPQTFQSAQQYYMAAGQQQFNTASPQFIQQQQMNFQPSPAMYMNNITNQNTTQFNIQNANISQPQTASTDGFGDFATNVTFQSPPHPVNSAIAASSGPQTTHGHAVPINHGIGDEFGDFGSVTFQSSQTNNISHGQVHAQTANLSQPPITNVTMSQPVVAGVAMSQPPFASVTRSQAPAISTSMEVPTQNGGHIFGSFSAHSEQKLEDEFADFSEPITTAQTQPQSPGRGESMSPEFGDFAEFAQPAISINSAQQSSAESNANSASSVIKPPDMAGRRVAIVVKGGQSQTSTRTNTSTNQITPIIAPPKNVVPVTRKVDDSLVSSVVNAIGELSRPLSPPGSEVKDFQILEEVLVDGAKFSPVVKRGSSQDGFSLPDTPTRINKLFPRCPPKRADTGLTSDPADDVFEEFKSASSIPVPDGMKLPDQTSTVRSTPASNAAQIKSHAVDWSALTAIEELRSVENNEDLGDFSVFTTNSLPQPNLQTGKTPDSEKAAIDNNDIMSVDPFSPAKPAADEWADFSTTAFPPTPQTQPSAASLTQPPTNSIDLFSIQNNEGPEPVDTENNSWTGFQTVSSDVPCQTPAVADILGNSSITSPKLGFGRKPPTGISLKDQDADSDNWSGFNIQGAAIHEDTASSDWSFDVNSLGGQEQTNGAPQSDNKLDGPKDTGSPAFSDWSTLKLDGNSTTPATSIFDTVTAIKPVEPTNSGVLENSFEQPEEDGWNAFGPVRSLAKQEEKDDDNNKQSEWCNFSNVTSKPGDSKTSTIDWGGALNSTNEQTATIGESDNGIASVTQKLNNQLSFDSTEDFKEGPPSLSSPGFSEIPPIPSASNTDDVFADFNQPKREKGSVEREVNWNENDSRSMSTSPPAFSPPPLSDGDFSPSKSVSSPSDWVNSQGTHKKIESNSFKWTGKTQTTFKKSEDSTETPAIEQTNDEWASFGSFGEPDKPMDSPSQTIESAPIKMTANTNDMEAVKHAISPVNDTKSDLSYPPFSPPPFSPDPLDQSHTDDADWMEFSDSTNEPPPLASPANENEAFHQFNDGIGVLGLDSGIGSTDIKVDSLCDDTPISSEKTTPRAVEHRNIHERDDISINSIDRELPPDLDLNSDQSEDEWDFKAPSPLQSTNHLSPPSSTVSPSNQLDNEPFKTDLPIAPPDLPSDNEEDDGFGNFGQPFTPIKSLSPASSRSTDENFGDFNQLPSNAFTSKPGISCEPDLPSPREDNSHKLEPFALDSAHSSSDQLETLSSEDSTEMKESQTKNDADNEFGDFGSETIYFQSPPEVVSSEVPDDSSTLANEEHEFGNFGDSPSQRFNSPPEVTNTQSESYAVNSDNDSENEDFGDFGDFPAQPADPSAVQIAASDMKAAKVEDFGDFGDFSAGKTGDDGFGDFDEGFQTFETQKTNVVTPTAAPSLNPGSVSDILIKAFPNSKLPTSPPSTTQLGLNESSVWNRLIHIDKDHSVGLEWKNSSAHNFLIQSLNISKSNQAMIHSNILQPVSQLQPQTVNAHSTPNNIPPVCVDPNDPFGQL